MAVTVGRGECSATAATMVSFDGLADDGEHIALVVPPVSPVPLVRMHSECLTGDVLGSARCDCGKQLDEALRIIGEIGGILLYLRQEGRGIGLYKKLDAYVLQDAGADTFRANELVGRGADERDYLVGAQMLGALEITQIRLLTNNMDKVSQLQRHGIDVESALPTSVFRTPENVRYLQAKADIAGHTLLTSDGRLGGQP